MGVGVRVDSHSFRFSLIIAIPFPGHMDIEVGGLNPDGDVTKASQRIYFPAS